MISEETSRTMRQLLRLVVTDGTGTKADVPGYDVGGKTGTAEKAENGSYAHHQLISSFCGVFPINDPQYLVFVMLDEPHGNKQSGGFATGGRDGGARGRARHRPDRAASGRPPQRHLCRGESLSSSQWNHNHGRMLGGRGSGGNRDNGRAAIPRTCGRQPRSETRIFVRGAVRFQDRRSPIHRRCRETRRHRRARRSRRGGSGKGLGRALHRGEPTPGCAWPSLPPNSMRRSPHALPP